MDRIIPYKILHIVNTLTVYGVPQILLSVIRNYDRSLITPTVCSLRCLDQIRSEIEAEGVEVIELGMINQRRNIIPDMGILLGLVRMIKERKIDIVHTHGYFPSLYGRYATIFANGARIVTTEHNQYKGRELKPRRRFMKRLLAQSAHALVAVSEAVKADMIRYDHVPAARITVIHNGIDADKIAHGNRARGRLALGIPADAQLIGAVGRLEDQKGHRYLIEALARMKGSHPKALVLIVGDGKLDADLNARARELGVADRVIFAGLRRDIPDMLAAMDVFAMPSLWEGFGIALLEAMAAARPMVATTIPPFREVLTEGSDALMVPVEDADALASAIVRLLDDPALAQELGKAARMRAINRYSIRNTVARHMELYNSILNSRAGS